MILTVYMENGEHYSFLDVKEFVVAGAVEITGSSEVDFGKQGFRFKESGGDTDVPKRKHKKT